MEMDLSHLPAIGLIKLIQQESKVLKTYLYLKQITTGKQFE